MTRLLVLAGSTRARSLNAALARALAAAAPAGVQVEVESIAGVPLYDGDAEAAHGLPPRVATLQAKLRAADGLVLVTPEYNASVPGTLKNAIDWLSRPPSEIPKVFGGKAVALAGATPGGLGTVLAQMAWLPVLRALGTRPWWGPRMALAKADGLFDDALALTDARTLELVARFMAGFAEFAKPGGAARVDPR